MAFFLVKMKALSMNSLLQLESTVIQSTSCTSYTVPGSSLVPPLLPWFSSRNLQVVHSTKFFETTLSTFAWISWNSAFQMARRKGKRRTDLSRNRQSFLTTSSARRQCNQPSTNVLMEIRRACLGQGVVLSISGARFSGRRQHVSLVAETS